MVENKPSQHPRRFLSLPHTGLFCPGGGPPPQSGDPMTGTRDISTTTPPGLPPLGLPGRYPFGPASWTMPVVLRFIGLIAYAWGAGGTAGMSTFED